MLLPCAVVSCDCRRLRIRLTPHALHATYTFELDLMKEQFDAALCKNFAHQKNASQKTADWWAGVKDGASLIIDASDVEKILECKTHWSDVSGEVGRCCKDSQIGSKMFASARAALGSSVATGFVDAAVQRLKGVAITAELVDQCKAALIATLASHGYDAAATFPRRACKFRYHDIELETRVVSLLDQWAVTSQAFIRTTAVNHGELVALWCEKHLAAPHTGPTYTVEACLPEETKRARQVANTLLEYAKPFTLPASEAMKAS